MKGILLTSLQKSVDASDIFIQALPYADDILKCKILLNDAKNNFYASKNDEALALITNAGEFAKSLKGKGQDFFLAHCHFLRGQIYYQTKKDKAAAVNEFKMAEFFFEGLADLLGVGLSCMEIARIHIKNRYLRPVWNYLKKSEDCLRKFGVQENLGVMICKAVALFHSAREEEAQALLKEIYKLYDEFGQGHYMIYQILDIYLDIHTRTSKYIATHGLA
jgi:tetratricopeptide (TPR) repeat protein